MIRPCHQHLTPAFAYVLHTICTHTENRFSCCSTEMKQMMNRTLSRALLTWKQRTTELDVSEWRRIKVILAKALQSFGSNQLKRPFVAWKTFKMQDKGSRLQDQLQDQHVSRRTRVSRDPTIAWKKQLSVREWSITPVSNSPAANLRTAFARIHKSRNAYQVIVCQWVRKPVILTVACEAIASHQTHTNSIINTYIHLRHHTQAAPTLPRTASCPMALEGAPLSKLSEPAILHVHSAINCMHYESAAVEFADSCKSCVNPVERCQIAPNNLIAGAERIRCTQSLSPTPLACDNVVTSSVGSVGSLKGHEDVRRLFDQVVPVAKRQSQVDTARKKIMTRLPQAAQAIVTTRRVVSSKVFRTIPLQVISPVLGAITIHGKAEPNSIGTKWRPVDISSFASSCVADSAVAQDALSNTFTPSCLLARSGWRVSTNVLAAPLKARLCSHFFEYGDVNPLGPIVHKVPSLARHRILVARLKTPGRSITM